MDRLAALEAFVHVVEGRSFSRAARELRVKQSTVSKWLAELEDQLGVQLIDRTTRSQRLTDPGRRFYARAKEILAAYDDATAELTQHDAEPRGPLKLSVPVVFGRLFVLPEVAKFATRHPQVEIEVSFSDRYVSIVEEGFDVAVRVGVPIDSSLRAHKLGETGRHLVASRRYLKQHGEPESPADLARHSCLIHAGGVSAGETWVFENQGRRARANVRGRFSANNSEAVLLMARHGLGIALLATWLVAKDVASGKLQLLLPNWQPPRAPIYALTAPARHVQPQVRAFVDHLASELKL